MPKNPNYSLALYEKAMPSGLGFGRMLECAAQTGFDRLEISIDESDARLARLDWTCEQKQELVGQIRQSGSAHPYHVSERTPEVSFRRA